MNDPAVEPCRVCGSIPPHKMVRQNGSERIEIVCCECSALLDNVKIENLSEYLSKVWTLWKASSLKKYQHN